MQLFSGIFGHSIHSSDDYEQIPSASEARGHKKTLSDTLQGIFGEPILPTESSISEDPFENEYLILNIFRRIHEVKKEERLEASRVFTPALFRKYVAKGADVNATDENGHSSIHYAAKIGRKDLVQELLRAKAQKDAQGTDGYTPLHLSAYQGHADTVQVLLNAKADTGRTSESPEELGAQNQCLPLHLACGRGHVAVVKLLIPHTAHLQAITFLGWNALHFAAAVGSKEIAELLLATKMFDVTSETAAGKSLLSIAKDKGHIEFAQYITPYFLKA